MEKQFLIDPNGWAIGQHVCWIKWLNDIHTFRKLLLINQSVCQLKLTCEKGNLCYQTGLDL